jgi:hypothetical protein
MGRMSNQSEYLKEAIEQWGKQGLKAPRQLLRQMDRINMMKHVNEKYGPEPRSNRRRMMLMMARGQSKLRNEDRLL